MGKNEEEEENKRKVGLRWWLTLWVEHCPDLSTWAPCLVVLLRVSMHLDKNDKPNVCNACAPKLSLPLKLDRGIPSKTGRRGFSCKQE